MHLQMGPDAFLAFAWSIQAASSPRQLTSEGLETWNQADLARQSARMVFGVQF